MVAVAQWLELRAVAAKVARSNRVGHPYMIEIINKKISAPVAFLVVFLIASLIAWAIIKDYERILKIRYERIEIQVSE